MDEYLSYGTANHIHVRFVVFFPNSQESSTLSEGLWLVSGLASRFFAGTESAGVGKISSGPCG